MEALEYTITRIGQRRHVSAHELLDGSRSYAKEKYGMLAHEVLSKWGLETTNDVGEVVFHLVDASVLARQDGDSITDFDQVFDLKSALEEGYFDNE